MRTAAFPLLVFYFLFRCIRDPRYSRRFSERLGAAPASFHPTPEGAIWFHAVSVGEVVSSVGVLRAIRERSPSIPLYISVTTVAGREVAEERLGGLADGIFYAPIDYAFAVRRVLGRIHPTAVVVMETEIWPVLYNEVKHAGCSLMIANGRISDRAFPSYRRWRFFFADTLRQPDAILAQSNEDAERYIALGALPDRIRAIGNFKYDAEPPRADPPRIIRELLAKLQPKAIWIAASTMPGADAADIDEDDAVIAAHRELAATHPRLLLILVPRRPERFDQAEAKLRRARVPYIRRSAPDLPDDLSLPCVVLLDSIGELASLFPLADVVFMAGTLARRGGHNVLEPAACRKAIVVGPHMENFRAIAAEFRQNKALLEISKPNELAAAVARLLDDDELRKDLGARASALALGKRGATQKALPEILRLQDMGVPYWSRLSPARFLLGPIAWVWATVSRRQQRRKAARARRLDTPVISVGGVSMGGTGKTPMVDHLAERLRESGAYPAILTRGYRRRSIETSILVKAGKPAPVSFTGDEAQIFVRSGYAHSGIGSDRFATGRLLEEKYRPDIFLLDDGFQHARLKRDLDLVLIDALNPFAGGAVFPLGNLREPLSALSRANAFILMRAAPDREYAGILAQLRSLNPHAPIFRARLEHRHWVNYRTREPLFFLEPPVAAFCGLGNPASFWGTLRALHLAPAFHWAFDDHHHYSCYEVECLAAQAKMHGTHALLTTEKDAMNLPDGAAGVLAKAGVQVYWLKIGVQIENESELLDLIGSRLPRSGTRAAPSRHGV
ncbi:MAG TPA: tetraacyldisaccharide 4'-kinase [Bryobacteraceae bacterium]|nr:tetraacyldisaccharide 4'-kinase [Bryobacteraceae bacterium]